MPTARARDIMTSDATWVEGDRTVAEAARMMASYDIGAIPICDGQGRLEGVITDRDIVVKVIAAGRDPHTTKVSELDQDHVVTIGADDSVDDALKTMKDNGVRRLPVIDGRDLVGVVSQADIARALPDKEVGDLVGAISAAPPNN
jgi:CBS domain-containing protein